MRFEVVEDLPVPAMRHDTEGGTVIYVHNTLTLPVALELVSRLL